MAEFDALTEGVRIGGLRSKFDIKILMCYLLKSIGSEISKTGLNNIMQSTQLVNFFEVNDALSQLAENRLVSVETHNGDEYYTLTPEGADIADKLDTAVPLSVREAVVKEAVNVVAREKMLGSVEVKTEKLERGWHVILTVYDGEVIMMQTVLYAADLLQAQTVEDRFLKNPEALYGGIIDILTQ